VKADLSTQHMIDFSKVEQSVRQLKQQVTAGNIDQATFDARLLELIDYAADGHYWMFGHKTERWYRHNGQHWIPDDPGRLRHLTPSHNPSQSNPAPKEPDMGQLWNAINWPWFVASLVALGLISWLVFSSV